MLRTLDELKELASECQPLKSQAKIYNNMYNRIFPDVLTIDGDFLEIGCFMGKTTIFMSRYLEGRGPERKLYTIDPHKADSHEASQCPEINVAEHFKKHTEGLDNHIHYANFSLQASHKIKDESICFAFIDGDHSEEGVLKDIELFYPKIVPGGIICFDDYNSSYWPGVGRALRAAVLRNDNYSIVYRGKKEIYVRKVGN